MEDIEIARNTKLDNIVEIATKAGIKEEELEQYGKYKAKIDSNKLFKRLANKKKRKINFSNIYKSYSIRRRKNNYGNRNSRWII